MSYWLMKSEPEVFGIDHLKQRPDQSEPWDGVRNYQVRNMLRDQMRPGDLAFFYHSNCGEPGIVGIMKVVSEARADPSAFDPDAKYFDPRSDPANPRWYLVDMRYVRHLRRNIPLREPGSTPHSWTAWRCCARAAGSRSCRSARSIGSTSWTWSDAGPAQPCAPAARCSGTTSRVKRAYNANGITPRVPRVDRHRDGRI